MIEERHHVFAAVYLFLKKDNEVLLQKRANGWMDGFYSLPAGHIDGGETIKTAMSRETLEETGLIIEEDNLEVVHVMHRLAEKEYIDFLKMKHNEILVRLGKGEFSDEITNTLESVAKDLTAKYKK